MEYYFDADVQIVDEFLRKLLSKNTSSQMKAIVETIQKEQDIVIRDMENDLMMVQGVAGSGKTSIALHRAAYLMYQGLSNHLLARNILIISPNSLFEQYISRVLPDLGEENVVSAVFEEIARKVLGHKRIQGREQYLERLFCGGDGIAKGGEAHLAFKASIHFAGIIDAFIEELPKRFIKFPNIDYMGQSIMSASQIRRKIAAAGPNVPLGLRLSQIEAYIMETVQSLHRARPNQEELRRIRKELQGFASLDVKSIYRCLFTDEYCLAAFMADIPAETIKATAAGLNNKTIAYDDVAAMLYLKLRLHGTNEYKNIRQIVIDEAQDYYPLHYKALHLLFGKAKYTVLGDYNQTLEKTEDASLYDQIAEILNKPKSILATMDKSFRSTNEIINFSAQFLAHDVKIRSFNRSGEEPQVHSASSEEELAEKLAAEAKRLIESGYQSVGLICKTAANAKRLYHDLRELADVSLVKAGIEAELQGIFIIPVYLAKGLEFDAVLICDADKENYRRPEDKKLLYVASTRALHYLGVYGVTLEI
jgi:DNA helicase-2/ATP-dependent DNA helicase PcrA